MVTVEGRQSWKEMSFLSCSSMKPYKKLDVYKRQELDLEIFPLATLRVFPELVCLRLPDGCFLWRHNASFNAVSYTHLVERNDLATVQQFLKPQEFRVLLVQIPDGGRKGELVLSLIHIWRASVHQEIHRARLCHPPYGHVRSGKGAGSPLGLL